MAPKKMQKKYRIDPREWQAKGVEKVEAVALGGMRNALVYACPGAGKTIGGLLIAKRVVDIGVATTILVVTHRKAIRSQWVTDADAVGLHMRVATRMEQLNEKPVYGPAAYAVSYDFVKRHAEALSAYCSATPVVVIFDEVHHCADDCEGNKGNKWGKAIKTAFEEARMRIPLTGTPFRSEGDPIPFVPFNSETRLVTPQVEYSYREALRDEWCRPINFRFYDGDMTWVDESGKLFETSFEDDVSEELESKRIELAVSPIGPHAPNMLKAADDKLSEVRAGPGPYDSVAGGLVVTHKREHAKLLADELEAICGERPVIVHGNTPDDSQKRIERFRESDHRWIIGVQMLSEGVDIKRLRVCVYLSTFHTELYFHQFCGRVMRVQAKRDQAKGVRERAYAFIPKDPRLVKIAKGLTRDVEVELKEASEPVTVYTRKGVSRRRREATLKRGTSECKSIVVGRHEFPADVYERYADAIETYRANHLALTDQNIDVEQAFEGCISAGTIPLPSDDEDVA